MNEQVSAYAGNLLRRVKRFLGRISDTLVSTTPVMLSIRPGSRWYVHERVPAHVVKSRLCGL